MGTIWTIVGTLNPLLLGIGLGLLGLTPPDFKNTRRLTWAAFVILSGWTLVWALFTTADSQTKIYTLIGIGATNVIILPLAMMFIGNREGIYNSTNPTNDLMTSRPEVTGPLPDILPKTPVRLMATLNFTPREEGPDSISLVLKNTGGSDALHLHIKDVHVFQKTIRFMDTIDILSAGEMAPGITATVAEYPASHAHDIGKAFYEAACAGNRGVPRNSAFDYQGEASFHDAEANEYRALWLFRFFPLIYRRVVLIDDSDMLDDNDEESGPYLIVTDVGIMKIEEPQAY